MSAKWRFLLTPRWLAWLGFVIAAVAGMLWLGLWQFRRAESGNALSWGYTFEWPLFAIFGVVFWVRTVIDEIRGRRGGPSREAPAAASAAGPAADGLPKPARRPAAAAPAVAEEPDPELDEYNAYLARLGQQASSRALRGWRR